MKKKLTLCFGVLLLCAVQVHAAGLGLVDDDDITALEEYLEDFARGEYVTILPIERDRYAALPEGSYGYGLWQQIKPLLDAQGERPEPPAPAAATAGSDGGAGAGDGRNWAETLWDQYCAQKSLEAQAPHALVLQQALRAAQARRKLAEYQREREFRAERARIADKAVEEYLRLQKDPTHLVAIGDKIAAGQVWKDNPVACLSTRGQGVFAAMAEIKKRSAAARAEGRLYGQPLSGADGAAAAAQPPIPHPDRPGRLQRRLGRRPMRGAAARAAAAAAEQVTAPVAAGAQYVTATPQSAGAAQSRTRSRSVSGPVAAQQARRVAEQIAKEGAVAQLREMQAERRERDEAQRRRAARQDKKRRSKARADREALLQQMGAGTRFDEDGSGSDESSDDELPDTPSDSDSD